MVCHINYVKTLSEHLEAIEDRMPHYMMLFMSQEYRPSYSRCPQSKKGELKFNLKDNFVKS